MKLTVTKSMFRDEFRLVGRADQFSYDALGALFDYFEECNPDMELDVIAICCEYAEMTTDEFIDAYSLDVDDDATDERKMHEVCEHIQHHSSLVGTFDNTVVFCSAF